MELDVRQLGNLSYKQLQELNKLQKEEDLQEAASLLAPQRVTPYTQGVTQDTAYQVGTAVGDSAFDEEVYAQSDLLYNRFGDIRANNQPTALKWINGIGKMGVLAGTTFADGIGGLVVGFGQGITNLMDKDKDSGFWSGFWDNPFSRAMQDIQKTAEEYMPNYRTEAEANRPWWENLGTANFWADTVIKNLGFAIGAAAGAVIGNKGITLGGRLGKWMAGLTKSARAEGLTNAVVGNTLMAFNEARVEALHNTTHWEETAIREVNSRADVELAEAERLYGKDTADYNIAAASIEKGRQEALDKINHERIQMGNAIMGMNVPILLLNNMFMYSKLFSGGANTMRRSLQSRITVTHGAKDAVNTAKKKLTDLGENATRAERRAAKQAVRDAERASKGTSGSIIDIQGHIGQYTHHPRGWKYGTGLWLAHGASEGAEEMSQRWISESAGQYQSFDVMEWYKRGKDPNYKMKATNLAEHVMKGYEGSWGNANAWEEFVVGAFTGLLGIPQIRSRTYRDVEINKETGKLELVEKKRSPIYLAGGLQEIMQEAREKNSKEDAIVKYLNNRLKDPKFQDQIESVASAIQSNESLEDAMKNNDLFRFKNEEFFSTIKDIMTFSQAGRLQDYKDLVSLFLDPSKQNAKEVVEGTTSMTVDNDNNIQLQGWLSSFADAVDITGTQQEQNPENAQTLDVKDPRKGKKIQFKDTPEAIEGVQKKLAEKRDRLIQLADKAESIRADIDNKTGGRFSNDDLTTLTTLRMIADNHQERSRELIREALPQLSTLFKSLTEKEKEKLQSLIHSTSGRRYVIDGLKTKSRIDPRLKEEEIKNQKDEILELLTNANNLNDDQADTAVSLFQHNSAFATEVNRLMVDKIEDNQAIRTMMAGPTIETLNDAIMNKEHASLYNNNLNLFLNKPDKLQEALLKADMEMYENYTNSIVDDLYEQMEDLSDVQDVRQALFNIKDPAIKKKLLQKTKDSGNKKLYDLIQTEQELSAFLDGLIDEINKLNVSNKIKGEIEKLLGHLYNDVHTKQDAENIVNSIINDSKYTVKTIDEDTMEPITEEVPVSAETQAAVTTAYNNTKQSNKFKSLDTPISKYDDVEDDAEEEEDSAEKESRKGERTDKQPLGDPAKGISSAMLHIKDIANSNIGLLKKFANGEFDSTLKENGWSQEDIDAIKAEASILLDFLEYKKKSKKEEEDEKNIKKPQIHHVPNTADSLKSSDGYTMQYSVAQDAKTGKTKIVAQRNTEIVTDLQKLGAYAFVDNGSLGQILKDNNHKTDSVPIYYIKNIPGYPNLEDRILLAVKLPRYMSGVNAVTINGEQYQIVGVLSDTGTEASKESYNNIANIVDQEFQNFDKAQGAFVSQFTNRMKRMYSGRVASDENIHSIQDILPNRKWQDSEEYALGIVNEHGALEILGGNTHIKPHLIQRNPFTTQYPGTRVLITKEADGKYYTKSIRDVWFNDDYLRDNPDSEVVEYIKKCLRVVADPKVTDTETLQAIRDLQKVLYFGGSAKINFTKNDNNLIIKYLGKGDSVYEEIEGATQEEIVEELLERLATDGFRFQINKNADIDHINMLVQSGAIASDLTRLHNVNADFVVHGVDQEGNLIGYDSKKTIETSRDYLQSKPDSNKKQRTVLFNLNGKMWDEFHFYEDTGEWLQGQKQKAVTIDDRDKLNAYYQLASALAGSSQDFIVSPDSSFAIEKLGNDKFNVITDKGKIDAKLAEQQEKEEKKKQRKEPKPEPSPIPKDDTTPEDKSEDEEGREPRGMSNRKPKITKESLAQRQRRLDIESIVDADHKKKIKSLNTYQIEELHKEIEGISDPKQQKSILEKAIDGAFRCG